jgi:hypothetical protein
MAGVVTNDAVAEALGIALDHPAEDVDLPTRADRPDRAVQRLESPLGEQSGLLVDVAAEERGAVVSVHTPDVGGDVDLDDVPVLERARIRDAVADDLIDRGAAGLGKAAIAEGRGIGPVVDQEFVHDAVEFVGGHSWGDRRRSGVHRLSGQFPGHAHPLDRVGALDVAARVVVRTWPANVGRTLDGTRHLPDRADRSLLHWTHGSILVIWLICPPSWRRTAGG